MTSVGREKYLALVFLGAQIAAFWPVWFWYARRMIDGSDEPFGLLALCTAGLFLISQWRLPKLSRWHLVISTLLVLGYVTTYRYLPFLLQGVIAVSALAVTSSAMLPDRRFRVSLLGLFLLSLPLIASLQFYLGYPVRAITTVVASQVIQLIGFPVISEGTCLRWMGELVIVDAPCSGIRMLWSTLYFTFALACFSNLNTIQTWLAYSSSMVVVYLGNLSRTICLFFVEARIVLAPDWAHQAIGVVFFIIVGGAVLWMHVSIRKRWNEKQWS